MLFDRFMEDNEMSDEQMMKIAKERVYARRSFKQHFVTYILVNTFLVVIWFVTYDETDIFWPVFPIMGWGLGLFFHYIKTRAILAGSEKDDIMKEFHKLKDEEKI